MRAHIINNGIVENTIEVDSLSVFPNLIDASLGGQIGDLWDGIQFTTPIAPKVVPQEVLMAQAREALIRSGIMPTQIDAIILALPSPQKELAFNQWEYAPTIKRYDSWVSELTPLIPLTEKQLDDLFILAATL